MPTRVGVVLFPGSNCELDALEAIRALGAEAELLWHGDKSTGAVDAVVIPGGFAHGDYLRPGAIARFSPVMDGVRAFAAQGGPVVGICNGFQVLTEAGLLPGALQKNRGLKFLCTTTTIRVETTDSPLTAEASEGMELRIPINHFEGNYTCDAETLATLRGRGPHRGALRRQPERLRRRHRRDLRRGPQRGRVDAPSGAGVPPPRRLE